LAEILRVFDEPIGHSSGTFHARVVGRRADDQMWEAWLEFVPIDPPGGEAVITSVESRQPAEDYLEYWAQGLTVVYAEGALDRALHPIIVRPRVVETPVSTRPASRFVETPPLVRGSEPVLDPFGIGSRSLDILSQELHALNRPRLLNIIVAYKLNPIAADLRSMTDNQLIGFIVAAVETQLSRS
jgi:hypothetical protein